MITIPMDREKFATLLTTLVQLVQTEGSDHGRVEYIRNPETEEFDVVAMYEDKRINDAAMLGVTREQVLMLAVLEEVAEERLRQDAKWGQQNYESGANHAGHAGLANVYKTLNDLPSLNKTWRDVLLEEVHEALGAKDGEDLRTELIQVAALAVAWVEAIDRKKNGDQVS